MEICIYDLYQSLYTCDWMYSIYGVSLTLIFHDLYCICRYDYNTKEKWGQTKL